MLHAQYSLYKAAAENYCGSCFSPPITSKSFLKSSGPSPSLLLLNAGPRHVVPGTGNRFPMFEIITTRNNAHVRMMSTNRYFFKMRFVHIILTCALFLVVMISNIGYRFPVPGTTCLGPAFSSNSDGDGPDDFNSSFFESDNNEKMDVDANEVINPLHGFSSHTMSSQKVLKKKRCEASSIPVPKPPKWDGNATDISLKNICLDMVCCKSCKDAVDNKSNCILEAFRTDNNELDYSEAVLFIRAMRKKIEGKSDLDCKHVVEQLMEIVTQAGRKDSNQPNDYTFFYKGLDRKLCRDSFVWLFMTSQNYVKSLSTKLRKGEEPGTSDSKHRYDNESFFEDIDYNTAVHIFEDWAGISAGMCL